MNSITWWHRIQMPDGSFTPGAVHHGKDGGDWPSKRFGLPEDLTGKKVLDVGAWDGFFSYEAEKRGAQFVLALDKQEQPKGFAYANRELKSNVAWQTHDITKGPCIVGKSVYAFDVVFCFGVFYHIKDPLSAMENLFLNTAPGGICLIETAMSQYNEIPMLEYRPRFLGDPTNFYYPSSKWMVEAAKEAGFIECAKFWEDRTRATFRLERGTNS